MWRASVPHLLQLLSELAVAQSTLSWPYRGQHSCPSVTLGGCSTLRRSAFQTTCRSHGLTATLTVSDDLAQVCQPCWGLVRDSNHVCGVFRGHQWGASATQTPLYQAVVQAQGPALPDRQTRLLGCGGQHWHRLPQLELPPCKTFKRSSLDDWDRCWGASCATWPPVRHGVAHIGV